MINYKFNKEQLIIKSWKFNTANAQRPFAEIGGFHVKLSSNAYHASGNAILFLTQDNIILDNRTLYEIMIKANIFL